MTEQRKPEIAKGLLPEVPDEELDKFQMDQEEVEKELQRLREFADNKVVKSVVVADADRVLNTGNPGAPLTVTEQAHPEWVEDDWGASVEADGAPRGAKEVFTMDDGPPPANPTIEQRIYAVARWAAALALTEMRDGPDHALIVRDAGPQEFLVSESEWGKINDTSQMGINYVLTGDVTLPEEPT